MPSLEAVTITGSTKRTPKGKTEIAGIAVAEQFILKDINIYGPFYNLSLKGLFVEISIYEDIFRSAMSGYVLLNDGISLIENRGIHGVEYIVLRFAKSESSTDIYERIFRVYKIDNRTRATNQLEAYSIHFCSEELLFSEQKKVSKAYSDTIANIVEDIALNELKISPDRFTTFDTSGVYDLIIPYKSPLDAINWLTNYARSDNTTNACDFVFFENRFGFHFNSIQEMIKRNKDTSFYYTYQQRNISDAVSSSSFSMINAYNYEILDSFDSLHMINSGMVANSLLSVDPLTRNYYFTTYSYLDNITNHTYGNTDPPFTVLGNRDGKYQPREYGSKFKYLITNKDQKKMPGLKEHEHDVANDLGIEQTIPHRTSQIPASHYHRIRITVPGNPNVTVGDSLFFALKADVSMNTKAQDGYYSGTYLVSSVRHLIDPTANYRTLIELVKESSIKAYIGHDPSDKTIKGLVKHEFTKDN